MSRAVVRLLSIESPLSEIGRFALVTGSALALIFAGRALPL